MKAVSIAEKRLFTKHSDLLSIHTCCRSMSLCSGIALALFPNRKPSLFTNTSYSLFL